MATPDVTPPAPDAPSSEASNAQYGATEPVTMNIPDNHGVVRDAERPLDDAACDADAGETGDANATKSNGLGNVGDAQMDDPDNARWNGCDENVAGPDAACDVTARDADVEVRAVASRDAAHDLVDHVQSDVSVAGRTTSGDVRRDPDLLPADAHGDA